MHKVHYLKEYLPPDFLIQSIHIHFDLQEKDTVVTAVLKIQRNPLSKDAKAPLILDGEALTLKKISIDGSALVANEFQVDEHSLKIFTPPDDFILETEVIIQPQDNTRLSGLYKSRSNFCTQCEAHGFRRITYYLDRPDVMARFITTITADKERYPILLSNGNLIEQKDLAHNRHWVHWEDPSLKPAYLFALVAGDFDLLEDQFITQSGRPIALKMYVEKGFGDQASFAVTALKHAMRWDEETFGREYDLDIYMIVAVSDFNMGAMENKGLNIFNTKYILARPDTATDADYAAIESVIGHEYFHNWSGNRITCRDWFQITLKEGLTVLRQQLFDAAMTSPAVARIDEVNALRIRQFPEDDGPNAHPVRPESYIEVNNFYTATVYYKGAEVIRMMRTFLGPEMFRKAMDLYFSRHDGQAVTTEDFVQAMADVSHKDFTQFLRWYKQSGTPVLDIRSDYDSAKKTFTLQVKQSCPPTPGQPNKEPFDLPLAMGLIDQQGKELPLQLENQTEVTQGTVVLEISQPQHKFSFINISEKPIPSLLRNFSAPVKLNYQYSLDELALLVKFDRDVVARWEAAQRLASNILLGAIKTSNEDFTLPALWIDTFENLLNAKDLDHHLLARLLVLPAESYLAQQMTPVNVEGICNTRVRAKQQIGQELKEKLLKIYHHLQSHKEFVYNTQEMGKRSVKNLCLNYLVAQGSEEYAELAFEQFKATDNMTDAMGALWALNDYPEEIRSHALELFYHRWQNQPLVINKWLNLQATSQLPDTLEKVQGLMQHPAFSIANPNNVYNLIGGFAGNMRYFHAIDGSGYHLIADCVLKIDPNNPQVAARVVEPLTRWQKFDEKRQALMKQELQHIKAAGSLSKDVYELVTKSLS